MTENTSLRSTKDRVLVSNNAQTIYDHINELEKDKFNNSKRWFWELLQNAIDSISNKERKVKIKLKLDKEKKQLTFQHNGDPFCEDDIIHLIFHGSSKIKDSDKIGRYGTGFMTTHLLSKKVQVEGLMDDVNTPFCFLLNRAPEIHSDDDSKNIDGLKEQLDLSYKQLEDSLQRGSNPVSENSEFSTCFTYIDLDEDGWKVAIDGVQLLSSILPVVIGLNDNIHSIEINNDVYELKEKKEYLFPDYAIYESFISISNRDDINIIYSDYKKYQLAVVCEQKNGNYSVIDISKKLPKLFYEFPLFGTENLGIPFIINSMNYEPKRERDGVYLSDPEDKKQENNFIIIKGAIDNYSNLIKFVIKKGYGDIFNLYSLNKSGGIGSWLNTEWFIENCLKKLINYLYEIETYNNTKLKELVIPLIGDDNTSIYSLIKELIPTRIVSLEEVEQWNFIMNNIAEIENSEVDGCSNIYTIDSICDIVNEMQSLDQFQATYFKNSCKEEVLKWHEKFILLIPEKDFSGSCASKKIILNQRNQFVISKGLRIDNKISNELKILANLYELDTIDRLIKSPNKFPSDIFEKMDDDHLVKELLTKNKNTPLSELQKSNIRNGFSQLFLWLLKNDKEVELKEIKVYTIDKEDQYYIRGIVETGNNLKLIVPLVYWENDYNLFINLVSSKNILPNAYAVDTDITEYNLIKDIIYVSPIISNDKILNRYDFEYLICPTSNRDFITYNKENLEFLHFDIAYLKRTADHILHNTGNSLTLATRFLEFIIINLLPKIENITVQYETGGGYIFYKYLWIQRLKKTKWVPEKEEIIELKDSDSKNDSYSGNIPSSKNIMQLINNSLLLKEKLNERKIAIFLNELGVSLFEMKRTALSSSEQLDWDLTFSSILSNKKVSATEARKILESPYVIDLYKKRIAQEQRIERNQEIGKTFENIFKIIFETDEFRDKGYLIEREPFGSDFRIDSDRYEDITEDVNSWKFGSVLVELKATGREYASMTEKQGKTAIDNENVYCLVVLPLDNYEINEENVRKHCRFITKIGTQLALPYENYKKYKQGINTTINPYGNVNLNIEEGTIRYHVKQDLWINDSLNFDGFIKWLESSEHFNT